MKLFHFSFVLVFGLFPLSCEGGLAAFSPNGDTLFVVKNSNKRLPRVFSIDLARETLRSIDGPDNTKRLVAIGVDKDSTIIAASKKFVWSVNLADNKWVQLGKAPTGGVFTGGCLNTATGDFVLTTGRDRDLKEEGSTRFDALSMFEAKRQKMIKVFCRRVDFVHGICCDRNGQFFFGHRFDLWHGTIDSDEERYVLTAYRCTPLASSETGLGNTSAEGVYRVAPTDRHLFVEISRAGGSGYGSLYRLPRPKNLATDEGGSGKIPYHSNERFKLYLHMLSEAKELEGADKAHSMTTAPDGKRVFIIDREKIQVFSADEPPKTLEIKIPD